MKKSNSNFIKDKFSLFHPNKNIVSNNENCKDLSYQLNSTLYEDVKSIPKDKKLEFDNKLRFYCKQLNYTDEYTNSWILHSPRLYITLEWLKELVSVRKEPIHLIETGGESVVTHLYQEYLPQLNWHLTNGDLRFDWGLPEQFADIILSTEVVEHLSDPPIGFQDSFTMEGLKSFMQKCYLTLKPGGKLFITTPNAASVIHLSSILAGYSPWFYKLHIREYTIPEISPIIKAAGFSIEKIKTIHCLTTHLGIDYSPLFNALLQYGFEINYRGDDIFIIAVKNESKVKLQPPI